MSREVNKNELIKMAATSTVIAELFDAQAALSGIRLWRYRKSPELQAAIRRARQALREVWDEMRSQR